MKNYTIEIIETSSKLIEVQAENEEQALDKIREQYYEEEIVLDRGDWYDTEFVLEKVWKF